MAWLLLVLCGLLLAWLIAEARARAITVEQLELFKNEYTRIVGKNGDRRDQLREATKNSSEG